jgi:cbb3-type cytochrome oxidase cytochrome c subunit
MPAFGYLLHAPLDTSWTSRKLSVLRGLGHPYTDAEIAGAAADARAHAERIAASLRKDGIVLDAIGEQSEAIAVIAYLQRLGTDLGWRPRAATSGAALAELR